MNNLGWKEFLGGIPTTRKRQSQAELDAIYAERMAADDKVVPMHRYDVAKGEKRIRELQASLKALDASYIEARDSLQSDLREEQEQWLKVTSELVPQVVPPKIEEGE